MRIFALLIVVFCLLTAVSCDDTTLVKPSAKLRLEYPAPAYSQVALDCPYSFQVNSEAQLSKRSDCWINVRYGKLKATIFLTYRPVNNNLDSLLYDAQKLTYDHTIKANSILEQPRVDSINNVYGMLYMIDGNAATQSQFYATDSVSHFVTGSVYFESKPNFDSLYPAVIYLREDVRRIMESIRWK